MTSNAIDMKSLNASKDRFMEEMRAVVEDAEALLNATTDQAGDGASAARARIEKSLHVVKERLIDAEEAVIHRTKQAAKVTDQYVHDNPWKAIGITACAGIIVGMLIARR
jgi:ElaB/YqjD/DUF883 family membrane-anchored ribosome-binding protein